MKIFLNPGHGGTDPGACSKSGTKESVIAAKVAEILEARLKLNGYPVQVYQQKITYFEISKEENKSEATCFISIHCNASTNPNAHGCEVLYCTDSAKGKEMATITQAELVKATGLFNRGIKPRNDLHVLNRTKAPAILVELAFISNPAEESMLNRLPEVFASAIWNAIKKFKDKKLI